MEISEKLFFYYGGLKQRCRIYKYYTDGSKRDPSTLTPEEKADMEAGMRCCGRTGSSHSTPARRAARF